MCNHLNIIIVRTQRISALNEYVDRISLDWSLNLDLKYINLKFQGPNSYNTSLFHFMYEIFQMEIRCSWFIHDMNNAEYSSHKTHWAKYDMQDIWTIVVLIWWKRRLLWRDKRHNLTKFLKRIFYMQCILSYFHDRYELSFVETPWSNKGTAFQCPSQE